MCQRELGRVQKWIDPGSNEKMPFGKHLGVFSSMVWARQAAKQARQAKAGMVPVSA